MSLQKKHRDGKMSKGSDRVMTLEEFKILLNDAYKFLGVVAPVDVSEYVFKNTDTDKDGLITYVQYFQIIETYVCKDPNYTISKSDKKIAEPPKEIDKGPARKSKLRRHFWVNLRKLYDAYVQGRTLNMNDIELNGLLYSIVGSLTHDEYSFLSYGLLQFNYQYIQFETFVSAFIFLMAQIGLGRFSKNYSVGKKTLNRDEFVILLKTTFSFLKLSQFKNSILYKIFNKIDKNQDGWITYDEYLDWVSRFLAVLDYYGDEFWVE